MNKVFSTLLAGTMLLGSACASNAVTFAILSTSNTGYPFTYTQSGTGGTLTGTDPDASVTFTNLLGGATVPGVSTLTTYAATLTVSETDSTAVTAGAFPIDGLSLTYTAVGGPLAGDVLLKITAGIDTLGQGAMDTQGGVFSVPNNQPVATLAGGNDSHSFTAPEFVQFTSGVIDTAGITEEGYSLSLTAQSLLSYTGTFPGPQYLASNNFLIGGQLTAVPAPPTTPEPGALGLAVGALVSLTALSLRRRRK
jgi:hypothetical protein